MNQEQLVREIAKSADLSRPQASAALGAFVSLVRETLATGGEISLRGFGRFGVATRPARKARNPRTGEEVAVPERTVARFVPSKDLRSQSSEGPRRR